MRMYRQGDVLIREITEEHYVKTGDLLKEIPKDDGKVVLAYGEVTGHSHAFEPFAKVKLYREDGSGSGLINWSGTQTRPVSVQELTRDPTLRRFLKVEADSDLVHEEHGTIKIPKGFYQIIIQREYSPEKIRQVED